MKYVGQNINNKERNVKIYLNFSNFFIDIKDLYSIYKLYVFC